VPSLVVFHTLPPLSIPANLVAIPAAGVVMSVGIPTGLLVGAAPMPDAIARILMLPSNLGCRWVLDVARTAAAWSPHGWAAIGSWLVQAFALAVAVMVRRTSLRRAILNG
jgi:competence protein ComEC